MFLSISSVDIVDSDICFENEVKIYDRIEKPAEKIVDYLDTTTEENDDITVIEEEEKQENKYFNIPLDFEQQDYIFTLSSEYNIPAELIVALISIESNFNPDAISATNDYGLCQINQINYSSLNKNIGINNLLDPYQNIHSCFYMLQYCFSNTDSLSTALMVYNHGYAGASKLWEQGIYSTAYTQKLIQKYNYYLQERKI